MIPSALIVCVAALLPTRAWANVAIGYGLMATAPVMLFALVPAILLEAPVLAAILGIPLRLGLKASAYANAISTVLGIVIAIILDLGLGSIGVGLGSGSGRGAMVEALVPMFFVSWSSECFVLARHLPGDMRRRITAGTFLANVLSYVALAVAALAIPIFDL